MVFSYSSESQRAIGSKIYIKLNSLFDLKSTLDKQLQGQLVTMPAKLLFLCLILQTGIALKQKTTIKPTMEVHGVVPDVIDVAPTAKIQVNQYILFDFVFNT